MIVTDAVSATARSAGELDESVTNFIIQIVTGIFAALLIGAAEKSHSFGLLRNAALGLVGGALSGYFLQGTVATLVTAAGTVNPPTAPENILLQVLAGAVSGAALLLIASMLKLFLHEHRAAGTKAEK